MNMGAVAKIFSPKPPKAAGPDPQIAKDLADARAAEAKRKTDADSLAKSEAEARERGKRGRRSLFSSTNTGAGFDELDDKSNTLG